MNTKNQSSLWHYKPELPIQVSAYFRKPFSMIETFKWIFSSWFPISEKLIIVILSFLSWYYFHPPLETTINFSLDWMLLIYLRNLILMILVAGGLHLYFYTFRKQNDDRHYDAKPINNPNKKFTFNDQTLDNIFWTLVSGVTIWSALEILMMWSMANGLVPTISFEDDLLLIILIVFIIPIWETVYFFLVHRFLHWQPIYKTVHHLHHRNTNVAPWSGMSMHPIEHILFLGSVLIHYIVPANPFVIIYHLQYYTLSAITTHTGFQGVVAKNKLIFPLGTFHHQIHHRYFECNYGGLEIPLDQWTGSFHDGTDESHQKFLDKRRQILKSRREKT